MATGGTQKDFFDFLASADESVVEFFEHLAMLETTGGVQAVVDYALDPLATGDTTKGILSPEAGAALLGQEVTNINDPDTFFWDLTPKQVAEGVQGKGPGGGAQIQALPPPPEVVVPPPPPPGDDGGDGGDDGGDGGDGEDSAEGVA